MSVVIERPDWWVDGHCVTADTADDARDAVARLYDLDVPLSDVKPWPPSNVGTPYIDVWLRIPEGEDDAEAEANTRRDGDGYRVDWSLTAVGLVKQSPWFADYTQAQAWLIAEGFDDYTVND